MRQRIKNKMLIVYALLGVFLWSNLVLVQAQEVQSETKPSYVVIIIDDWGNNMAGSEEMLKLPIPLTGAVIPGMPFDKQDAEKLHEAGKEVMLHVPLEPENGKISWLGPKGITVGMSEAQVLRLLNEAKESIPYIKGMNNHMGSRAMKNETIVKTLMSFAKENELYFVDSGTTDTKISQKYMQINQLPFLKRDIFLDNTPSTEYVKSKLRELEEVAKTKGYAIGIGHVGPQKGPHTARALKELIPQMQKDGIKFVTVSELFELGIIEK